MSTELGFPFGVIKPTTCPSSIQVWFSNILISDILQKLEIEAKGEKRNGYVKDNAVSAMLKLALYLQEDSVRGEVIKYCLPRIPLTTDQEEQKHVDGALRQLIER